jgi:phosphate transport system permease protein
LSVLVLLAAIAALAAAGFGLARGRALAAADRGARLHSLPAYYGWYGALWSALPGIAVTGLWFAIAPSLLPALALAPGAPEDRAQLELFWNDVENTARGGAAEEFTSDAVRDTARRYLVLRERALAGVLALTMLLGLAGGAFALRTVRPALAARVHVERFLRACCSCPRRSRSS